MKPLTFFLFFFFLLNVQAQEIALLESSNDLDFFSLSSEEISTPDDSSIKYKTVEATCWCTVSREDLTNKSSSSGPCRIGLTDRVGVTFKGVGQQSIKNQRKCDKKCSDVAARLTSSELQKLADCACNAGSPNNTIIRAYSSLGTRKYSSAYTIGTLKVQREVTENVWTCPDGWEEDTTQNDPNKKCKKDACKLPYPVPNRHLPNLPGFIYNNTLVQYRKGKSKTIVVSPASCELVK